MKRFIRLSAIVLAASLLACPQTDARGRNNNSGGQSGTEQHRVQNNNARHGGNRNTPNRDNKKYSPTNRPGHFGNNQAGHPGNNGYQPGSGNNGYRPGSGNNGRPTHPQYNYGANNRRPDAGYHNPGPGNHNRPHHGYGHHFTPGPPPPRPYFPAHPRPWYRPTPPVAWRPAPTWRPFSTILGITLGSAINFTINALVNSGYNVTGYNNSAVYVTNVPMLNMMWPDATLYYGNGGLCGSEFVYSTPGYNLSRYNSAYNSLIATYGYPVSVSNSNGVMTSTWWGTGNQFITLSFCSGLAGNGSTRFFTTLSFGN